MSLPTVVIVGADKGGVGKTTVTRTLLDFLKSSGIDYRVFDTEPQPGVLKRFFPNAEVVDLGKSDGQMAVFDTLQRSTMTVIDCKASLLSEILKTLGDIGMLEAVQAGKLKVVILHILGSTQESLKEVQATASIITGCEYFLVTNHINDTEFFAWNSDEAKAALGLAKAVIDVPKLDQLAAEHVDRASVPFNDYVANMDNSMVMRGKTKTWLGKVFANLAVLKLGQ